MFKPTTTYFSRYIVCWHVLLIFIYFVGQKGIFMSPFFPLLCSLEQSVTLWLPFSHTSPLVEDELNSVSRHLWIQWSVLFLSGVVFLSVVRWEKDICSHVTEILLIVMLRTEQHAHGIGLCAAAFCWGQVLKHLIWAFCWGQVLKHLIWAFCWGQVLKHLIWAFCWGLGIKTSHLSFLLRSGIKTSHLSFLLRSGIKTSHLSFLLRSRY